MRTAKIAVSQSAQCFAGFWRLMISALRRRPLYPTELRVHALIYIASGILKLHEIGGFY